MSGAGAAAQAKEEDARDKARSFRVASFLTTSL